MAVLTASRVSAGRTSRELGRRGSWAALRSSGRGADRHQPLGEPGLGSPQRRGRGRDDARRGELGEVGPPVGRRPLVRLHLRALQAGQLPVDVRDGGVQLRGGRGRGGLELGDPTGQLPGPLPLGVQRQRGRRPAGLGGLRCSSAAATTWSACRSTTSR